MHLSPDGKAVVFLLALGMAACSDNTRVKRELDPASAGDGGTRADGQSPTGNDDPDPNDDGTTRSDGGLLGAGDGATDPNDSDASSGADDDASSGDGSDAETGTTDGDAGTGPNGGDASANQDAGANDSGSVPVGDAGVIITVDGGQVLCGDHICACANGSDDDGDGRPDLSDPECISTWDDDEDSFATGMPGDNRDDACQDCFFDGNSGSGNDGCRLPTSCLLTGLATSAHGSCSSCEQTAKCRNYCAAYTPNGCDCFGCCDVRVSPTDIRHVLLGKGCNLEGDVLTGCTACVPSTTCVNECGRCELCPGKTEADLPADCSPPPPDGGIATEPPAHTCEGGQICGEGFDLCPAGSLCQFGCCVLTPA